MKNVTFRGMIQFQRLSRMAVFTADTGISSLQIEEQFKKDNDGEFTQLLFLSKKELHSYFEESANHRKLFDTIVF